MGGISLKLYTLNYSNAQCMGLVAWSGLPVDHSGIPAYSEKLFSTLTLQPPYHTCLCIPPTLTLSLRGTKIAVHPFSEMVYSNTIRCKLGQLSNRWSQLRVSSNKALWLTRL